MVLQLVSSCMQFYFYILDPTDLGQCQSTLGPTKRPRTSKWEWCRSPETELLINGVGGLAKINL